MLIGRLGTEPELRYTPQGTPITTFRLAVSRQWRDSDGHPRDETDWFTVVAWSRLAEICGQYLHKAARVYIEGRLQNHSWDEPQSGEKRQRTEIVATDMIILDGRVIGDESGNRQPRTPLPDVDPSRGFGDEDIPF